MSDALSLVSSKVTSKGQNDKVMFLYTFSGNFTALTYPDADFLWSFDCLHGSFLNATYKDDISEKDIEYFIPSLNGMLYRFFDKKYDAIDVLHSNTWYADANHEESYTRTLTYLDILSVEPLTGKVLYTCRNLTCSAEHNFDSKNSLILEVRTLIRFNRNYSDSSLNWKLDHKRISLTFLGPYRRALTDSSSYNFRYDYAGNTLRLEERSIQLSSPLVDIWVLDYNKGLSKIDISSILLHSEMEGVIDNEVSNDLQFMHYYMEQPYFVPLSKYVETSSSLSVLVASDISNDKHNSLKLRENINDRSRQTGQYWNEQKKLNLMIFNKSSKNEIMNHSYPVAEVVVSNEDEAFLKRLMKFAKPTLVASFTATIGTAVYYLLRGRHEEKYKVQSKQILKSFSNKRKVLNEIHLFGATLENKDLKNLSRYSSDFIHIGKIGSGGFGHVYKAENVVDGCIYAVKRVRLPQCSRYRDKVMREVKVLAQLEHSGIVRFYNAWFEPTVLRFVNGKLKPTAVCPYIADDDEVDEDSDFGDSKNHYSVAQASDYVSENISTSPKTEEDEHIGCSHDAFADLYIQMQLCKTENLQNWLQNNTDNRDFSVAVSYFKQIFNTIHFIHSNGFIHRDLKPSNILFSFDGTIKIGDFGLVTFTRGNLQSTNSSFDMVDDEPLSMEIPDDILLHSHTKNVGTMLYMAPEQVEYRRYDQTVDIYSMGVLFTELLLPFNTVAERCKVLCDAKRGIFPDTFIEKYSIEKQLIEWMLIGDLRNRPTTFDINNSGLLEKVWSRFEL